MTLYRLSSRTCRPSDLGVDCDDAWPAGAVLLASMTAVDAVVYALAIPTAALRGPALTDFLSRVSPFGSPPPPSLIRAYSLPDAPFPSILLKEHEGAPDGLGTAYDRFLAHARRDWLAALEERGPGLCPALMWRRGSERMLIDGGEGRSLADQLDARLDNGARFAGVADGYLGRGLLLRANPELSSSWPTMMSLGGVTKIRKITGREFPVWVDLPAHRPALLASPLLDRAEQLLAA